MRERGRSSGMRFAAVLAGVVVIAMMAMPLPASASWDWSARWQRAAAANERICGWAGMSQSAPAFARGVTARTYNDCWGGTGPNGPVDVKIVLQVNVLGTWANCSEAPLNNNGPWVMQNATGGTCLGWPSGFPYRALSVHGGDLFGTYHPSNHYPVVSPTRIV